MARMKKLLLISGAVMGLGLLLMAGVAQAASITNSAGATVELLTTEADSGGVLTNSAGATLEVLTTDQESADLRDGAGAWAFLGLLDSDWAGNAARLWALYE